MNRVIEKRLLSIKEAAVYLGRGTYSMRELLWGGQLPYLQCGKGGKLWVDRKDLDSWIEANKRREVS
jgi:excisionase family DNA binding protein